MDVTPEDSKEHGTTTSSTSTDKLLDFHASSFHPVVDLYHLSKYSFGVKDSIPRKDYSSEARVERMRSNYATRGMRRMVEGVLLVHDHGHPHVLVLQVEPSVFVLPGGRLKVGEDEVEGLKRKLDSKLAPLVQDLVPKWGLSQSELVSVTYRPAFDSPMYPYIPPHTSMPKESKKVRVIPLPEKCAFAVPQNFKLLAIPMIELHNNEKYGDLLSALPSLLSRFKFNYIPLQKE
jgi:cleavage and polyadenylation specificity factor subunit 5